jgi:hypothetical protein
MGPQVFVDMPGIGRDPILWNGGDGFHAKRECQVVNGDVGKFGCQGIGQVLQVLKVQWYYRGFRWMPAPGEVSGDDKDCPGNPRDGNWHGQKYRFGYARPIAYQKVGWSLFI